MKMRKCLDKEKHKDIVYTLKEICPVCKKETKDAHYKFIHLTDAPKNKD